MNFRLTRREVGLVAAIVVLAGLGIVSVGTRPTPAPKPAQLTAEKGTLEEACLNGADTYTDPVTGKVLTLWAQKALPQPARLIGAVVPGDSPEQPHLDVREPTEACPNRKAILESMQPPSKKAMAQGFAKLNERPTLGFVASSNCDYFISNTGSNGAAGTFNAPWRGISTKMNLMTPGTVVCGRQGTWNDWAPVDFSGISNVSLVAFECEEPTLADTSKTLGDFIIMRNSNNGILIDGFNFIGGGSPTYGTGAIEIGPSNSTGGNTNITIQDNTFTDIGYDDLDHDVYIGANLGGQSNIVIQRNRFLTGRGGAIHSYHAPMSSAVTIIDNEITGFKWGILVSHEGYQNWTIRWNAVYNASDGGIRFGYYAEGPSAINGFTISNNIAYALAGNLGALAVDQAFITDGWSARVNESSNDWYRGGSNPISYGGNPASGYVSLAAYQSSSGEGAGDVSVDPKFNSVAAGDLRPTPSTPASVAAMGPRYSSFPTCSGGGGGGGGTTMRWANNVDGIGAVALNGVTIPSTSNFYAYLDPTPAITAGPTNGFSWTVNGVGYHTDDFSAPYQLSNPLITAGSLGCGSKTIVATEVGPGNGGTSYTATFTITCPPTTTTTTAAPTTTTTLPPTTTIAGTTTTAPATTTTTTTTTTAAPTTTTTIPPVPGPFPCGFTTRLSGTSPSGTAMLDGSLATYTSVGVGSSVQFTFVPGTVHRGGVVFKANAGAQSFTVQVWTGTSATKGQWVTVAKISLFSTKGTDKCASVPISSVGTFGKVRVQILARESGTNPRIAEFAVGT